ncbi:DUF3990 domain-containing protein [Bacteroides sp. GD17]|uniref:DUF3990 domain-containing protein n=1 Tax=Bacteroides sp. GD17 TaxID=3139826 RepID=UPI0025D4B62A|nr:DUF3990 domain-containing protein [uncultured Bacteroides sp.]
MPYKDFGKGFYLTDIEQQAKDMAIRKSRFVLNSFPCVLKYEFNEIHLKDGSLQVKFFDKPTEEWAQFIIANRYNPEDKIIHNYDIVIGPIADDGIALQIGLFRDGLIDLAALTKALEYKKLNKQYFFGTAKAINLLNKL